VSGTLDHWLDDYGLIVIAYTSVRSCQNRLELFVQIVKEWW
jgi:hypothetical protein